MLNGRITTEQMEWLQEKADELGWNLSAALRQAQTDVMPPRDGTPRLPPTARGGARMVHSDGEVGGRRTPHVECSQRPCLLPSRS